MNKKELICIVCPNGCPLEAEWQEEEKLVGEVTGNLCDKGPVWAVQELTNPVRTIASSVRSLVMNLSGVAAINPPPRS